MEKETISLSRKEQRRLMVLNQVQLGKITAREAAERLDLSERQVRRLLAGFREKGAGALAHGNRGRKPAISFPEALKARVLELAAQPLYAGCNDTHLTELLAQREGIVVSRATVRSWLRSAGRPSPRKRRPARYRKCRERAPREGLLLQIDACFHPWFEDRGPRVALVAAIDDATGAAVSAHFRPQEDTDGYFTLLAEILLNRGIPGALYHDGRSTFVLIRHYHDSVQEQLEGVIPQTQFARAADALGIVLIHAQSPQAKGRIERLWLSWQDRLVKEMRLAGISNVEDGNAFLPGFIAAYNAQFALPPAEPESGYIALPANLDVAAVCCSHFVRAVARDNTISVNGVRLQVPPGPAGRSYRGQRVTAQRRLDGSWAIYLGGQCLAHPAAVAPAATKTATPVTPAKNPRKPPPRPSENPSHPWHQANRLLFAKRQS
jgi:transposase